MQLKSRREEQPIDEFHEFNELLTGAFPQVFPLGMASLRNKRLNKDELEHLLLQHTNAASKNRELLFYLFDCDAKHTVINNMAKKVRKEPQAFAKHAKLLRSENFK